MRRKWKNVPGSFTVEVMRFDNGPVTDSEGHILPIPQTYVNNDGYAELTINFASSGYHDPGCMYLSNGDPGYPPEEEDERIPVDGSIDGKPLDKATLEEVFDHFIDAIYKVEIDTEDDQ